MQPRDGCLATGTHPGHGPGHLWVPRLQQLVSRDVPRRQDDHDGHGEPCSKIAKKPTGPARAVLRESVLPQACDAGGAGGSPAQGPGARVRLPLCAGRRAQAVKGVAQGPGIARGPRRCASDCELEREPLRWWTDEQRASGAQRGVYDN